MAQLINSDQVVVVDVDDTLLMWNDGHDIYLPSPGTIELTDPYNHGMYFLKPHLEHIKLIQKYKTQGYTVIVWSAGGCLWAQEAVTKLGISKYVDFIMAKPIKYVDDLKASEILGSRVYIPFKPKDKVIEPGEQE